jgi:hypothetical protein
VLATLTAVIHFAVAGAHFQEYWAFGVFMLVAGWLQLVWALGIVVRPSRTLLAAGAVLNGGVVVVYVITRTVGDVIGPTPSEVEPVGFGDLFCTICEATMVAVAVLLLLRPLTRSLSRSATVAVLASVSASAVVLLSVSLVDGGPEMVMSMDSAAASTPTISLTTDSPAGPVRMPNPDMQMEAGMQMAGGACTKSPTTQQQSAAVDLVNISWADAKKYQSLAAAKNAGYRPVTPTGKAVVHYINPANYRATAKGGTVIDPSAPQSLVYANTPNGAVLVATMYIAAPRSGSTPDPGGCLTQWHVHTNLCFSRGSRAVVGIADPKCPAGSVNRVSPPMLHVWFVPIPGGPTAVDASDAQIVHAAEHVAGPHNGTA